MSTRNISLEQAGSRARDVMLTDPDVHDPATSLAEARAAFESPKQKLLVVCDDGRYVGSIRRDGIPDSDDSTLLTDHLDTSVPTVGPDAETATLPAIVADSGVNRIPVVDPNGRLLGLICFNPGADTFCVR